MPLQSRRDLRAPAARVEPSARSRELRAARRRPSLRNRLVHLADEAVRVLAANPRQTRPERALAAVAGSSGARAAPQIKTITTRHAPMKAREPSSVQSASRDRR